MQKLNDYFFSSFFSPAGALAAGLSPSFIEVVLAAGLASIAGLLAGAFVAGILAAGAFVAGAFVAGAVVVVVFVVAGAVTVVAGLAVFVVVLAAGVQAEIKAADAAIAVTVNNLTFIFFIPSLLGYLSKLFEKYISNKFEILALTKKNASVKLQIIVNFEKNII